MYLSLPACCTRTTLMIDTLALRALDRVPQGSATPREIQLNQPTLLFINIMPSIRQR